LFVGPEKLNDDGDTCSQITEHLDLASPTSNGAAECLDRVQSINPLAL
jgi:hypothetical protein